MQDVVANNQVAGTEMKEEDDECGEHERCHGMSGIATFSMIIDEPIDGRRRQVSEEVIAQIRQSIGCCLAAFLHSAQHNACLAWEHRASQKEENPQ